MPNRRNRKARRRVRADEAQFVLPLAECLLRLRRGLTPLLRPPRLNSPAARHMRNAGIEVLEAMRDVLDETIAWLRHERPAAPEMRRIRVQG